MIVCATGVISKSLLESPGYKIQHQNLYRPLRALPHPITIQSLRFYRKKKCVTIWSIGTTLEFHEHIVALPWRVLRQAAWVWQCNIQRASQDWYLGARGPLQTRSQLSLPYSAPLASNTYIKDWYCWHPQEVADWYLIQSTLLTGRGDHQRGNLPSSPAGLRPLHLWLHLPCFLFPSRHWHSSHLKKIT